MGVWGPDYQLAGVLSQWTGEMGAFPGQLSGDLHPLNSMTAQGLSRASATGFSTLTLPAPGDEEGSLEGLGQKV